MRLSTETTMTAKQTAAAEKILAEIASKTLGIETLETRNSDSLDFSKMSVWQLKEALVAAFEAGRKSA